MIAALVLAALVLTAGLSARFGVAGAVTLAAMSVLWFVVNSPMEGPTLLVLTRDHGLTGGDLAGVAQQTPGIEPLMLGDIVIAYETLTRECEAQDRVFLHHLAHLAVHGFLHLMGYDHQDDSDAEAMEQLETAILARLDMPDPYLARDLGA